MPPPSTVNGDAATDDTAPEFDPSDPRQVRTHMRAVTQRFEAEAFLLILRMNEVVRRAEALLRRDLHGDGRGLGGLQGQARAEYLRDCDLWIALEVEVEMRADGMVKEGEVEVEEAMDALDGIFWGVEDREMKQGFEEVMEWLKRKAAEVQDMGKRIGERIEEVERMDGGDFVVVENKNHAL